MLFIKVKATVLSGTMPLYCHHSLSYEYAWDNLSGNVGMHSPVLYVNKPGVYHCSVTDNQKRCVVTLNTTT